MNRYGRFIRHKKRWMFLRWIAKTFFKLEDFFYWLANGCEFAFNHTGEFMHEAALLIYNFSSEREPESKGK
jgi:hypothetical protein